MTPAHDGASIAPPSRESVEIRERLGTRGHRMLVVAKPFLTAMQFPADDFRQEEWLIIADSGLEPARVCNEDDARAWLEFLARNLARHEPATA